jgi:ATP-dependent DNA helicase RecG
MASLPELMRLFQEGGFYHYDKTEVEDADLRSLARYALSEYFQPYEIAFDELDSEEQITLLKNTDILGPGGHPTVAGLMIFGAQPQR